jgi:hypothetical protein
MKKHIRFAIARWVEIATNLLTFGNIKKSHFCNKLEVIEKKKYNTSLKLAKVIIYVNFLIILRYLAIVTS